MFIRLTTLAALVLTANVASAQVVVQFRPNFMPGPVIQPQPTIPILPGNIPNRPFFPPTVFPNDQVLFPQQFPQVFPQQFPQNFNQFPQRNFRTRDLERFVERTIQRHLGRLVDDVDVDVDVRRNRVRIQAELRHPGAFQQLRAVVYSLPELQGFNICLEVD